MKLTILLVPLKMRSLSFNTLFLGGAKGKGTGDGEEGYMKDNDIIIEQLKDLVEELHEQTLKQEAFETTHIRIHTLMKNATNYTHLLNEAYTDLKETLEKNRPLPEVFIHTENKRSAQEATIKIMKKIARLNNVIKDIKEHFGTVNYFV